MKALTTPITARCLYSAPYRELHGKHQPLLSSFYFTQVEQAKIHFSFLLLMKYKVAAFGYCSQTQLLKCSEQLLGDRGCGQVNKMCGRTKTSVRCFACGQMLVQVTLVPGSQKTPDMATILVQNQGHEQNSKNPSASIHLSISNCNMMQQKLRGRKKKI